MPENTNNNENKNTSFFDEALDWLETLILYCFIAILLMMFVVKLIVVDGDSMNSTLYDGQKLIATNLFYTPEQGDIIIFNNDNPVFTKTLIKRVIATEGQKVKIDFENAQITVDGKILDEAYLTKDFDYFEREDCPAVYEFTVEDNHVFVMGDNRNDSTDSRDNRVGQVDVDSIVGKAILRIYPFKFL